jgi:hypothetical protein
MPVRFCNFAVEGGCRPLTGARIETLHGTVNLFGARVMTRLGGAVAV